MKYWLCVTNKENWGVVRRQQVWGVSERNRRSIERVKPEDLLVFYVMPKKISGIFKATSEPFESREKVFGWAEFGKEELFPYRVKLEPVIVPEKPLSFNQLLPKLNFITNKKMWSGYLRRAMRTIPEEDYETIRFLTKK